MDVDGNRVIQEVLTVYPQVIPKLWITYYFVEKRGYVLWTAFLLIICSVYNIKLGKNLDLLTCTFY